MMLVMSSGNDGGVVSPPEWVTSAVGDEKSAVSTGEYDFAGGFGFGPVTSNDEAAGVRGFGSDETRISGNVTGSRVSKLESEENRTSSSCSEGGGNQHSPSACRLHGTSEKSSSRSGKLEHKTNMNVAKDHDSIVSAFDQFAAKGNDEAVGYGFKIGDMVWGKVKSHPWWPGQIYNETLASASVRRGKHEGHVLVAFFGDSSYGWFDPEELIPFEENFAEKSRQTTLRSFLNAVEEAADELARRSSLGLTCRCRNEFNFSPLSVDGYFVVDVGDSEAGVYSLGQISEAQDSFQPKDMVSFLHEVALKPMSGECSSVEFIKQRAATLAIRKGFFEDFDETYAQAFGTRPLRPPRPSAPVAVDPLKAPLSGRLVIAEALGNRKISPKPAKTKGQVEKDKYSFTRREDSVQIKSKKASSAQVGYSPRPLSVNGQLSGIRNHMYEGIESSFHHDQDQPIRQNAPSDFRPSESSRKLVGGIKKDKFMKKRPAGESTADNALHVKKKKRKVINAETGGERRQFPLAVSDSIVATKTVSRMPLHIDSSGLEDKKIDASVGSSTSQSQQADDFAKIELQMLVSDLRALALDPFHGEQKSCPAVIKQVFLKFRSLVYQKSLVLVPPVESVASEGDPIRLPSSSEKTNDKKKKPPFRPDDLTRGGKKRDLPETVQKKKLDTLEGVKRKKVDEYLDSKKKKIDISKSLTVEKRILQRSADYQLGNAKDSAVRAVPSTTLLKAVKQRQESSKKAGQMTRSATPTMLVMKFPAGAALPSIPQLKAKFARFGPLDQSATRVFWKTYTCRLVYQHKIDAQAALKFVDGGSNLFGNTNVRCYLRDTEAEAVDSEPVQPQKEDMSSSQARDSAVEANTAAKAASQQLQHLQSLKSCLKKPYADEGGMGGGRGGKVKFVLGGEESSSKGGELPLTGNKKSRVASFSHGASSVHSSLDSSSKNLPKFNLQSSNTFVPSLSPEQTSWGAKDISEEMVNLLMRCNDVVNNLSAALGCMPYYPL